MERKVEQVIFPKRKKQLLKVAAYARVSSGKDEMLHSLSAQVDYYNDLITSNPEWLFCDVFADENKTGTKADRENFVKLIDLCRQGHINMIITKSISRFAKNTVTLLETVRELKYLNVDVFFEEQNIHTISAEGELLLTILSGYAQEESLSVSENQKWKIRHGFEEGKPTPVVMLGYKLNGDTFEVIPKEAKVVKMIFDYYLSGMGQNMIANKLNEMHIKTKLGNEWDHAAVRRILQNEKYCGDLLLQKFYKENHLTKRKMKNDGVLAKYYVTDAHEPIIDRETFDKAKERMEKNKKFTPKNEALPSPFTKKLVCGGCSKNYRRRTTRTKKTWICPTYNYKGKKFCPTSKQIPEDTLISVCCEVLGIDDFNEELFNKYIDKILIPKPNELIFKFTDGHEQTMHWNDRSRSESWTAEKRLEASRRVKWKNKSLRSPQEKTE